jgi:hypothetical protein
MYRAARVVSTRSPERVKRLRAVEELDRDADFPALALAARDLARCDRRSLNLLGFTKPPCGDR